MPSAVNKKKKDNCHSSVAVICQLEEINAALLFLNVKKMSIVLKLQTSSLIWKLTKWDSPPLSCHFCLGSFICCLDLLLKGMRGAKAKFHPKMSHACKWFQMPSCPCNRLQRALIKVTQDILKWAPALLQGAVPHSHNCSHHSSHGDAPL